MTTQTGAREPTPARDVDERDAPPTHRRVTFLVSRVNARIGQVANPLFREHRLDLVTSRILALLVDREAMRVGELVEAMALPQSTVSHQIQRLEKRGLLRKRRPDDDQRAVAVSLTAKGRRIALRCSRLSLSVYRHLAAGLAESEIVALTALLDKAFATLDSFRAD